MKKLLKTLRNVSFLNKPFRFSIKLLYKLNKSFFNFLIKHAAVAGVVKIKFGNIYSCFYSESDDYTLKQYYFNLHDEPGTAKLMLQIAPICKVVMDIGANTGFFSINIANLNTNMHVISFEPVPSIADRLEKNTNLNNLANIQLVRKIVSSRSNELSTIYIPNSKISYSASLNRDFHDNTVIEKQIETISIDDYITTNNIKSLELIKIDVEWHEYEVLLGAENTLNNFSPLIIAEILFADTEYQKNPSLIGKLPADHHIKIQNYLKSLNYFFYKITKDGIYRMEDIEIGPEERNYLFSKRKSKRQYIAYKEKDILLDQVFTNI